MLGERLHRFRTIADDDHHGRIVERHVEPAEDHHLHHHATDDHHDRPSRAGAPHDDARVHR